MKRVLPLCALVTILPWIAGVADASFRYIPLEQLVERNPAVVVGKVARIKSGTGVMESRKRRQDFAMIRIDAVLKNEASDPEVRVGAELPLAMPAEIRSSAQFRHEKGTEGVWLLSRDLREGSGGYYRTLHPAQRQPLSKREEIAALIERQKKEQADALTDFQIQKKRHAANIAACPLYTVKDFEADLLGVPDAEVELSKLSYAMVRTGGKTIGYVFVDRNGKVQLATRYHVSGPFSEGLVPVGTTVKGRIRNYGFINRDGKLAFEPIYNNVRGFSEGLGFVQKDKKWGAVDRTGELVIPIEYDDPISLFQDGSAQVRRGDETLLIDKSGSVLRRLRTGRRWYKWSNGLFPMGHSLVNRQLQTVLEVTEEELGYEMFHLEKMSGGLIAVQVTEKQEQRNVYSWGFLDKAGKWAIAPQYAEVGDFSEGLVAVPQTGEKWPYAWGYVDTSGNVVVKQKYIRAEPFSNGLAAVKTLAWVDNPHKPGGIVRVERWGYIDRTGKIAIPAWFRTARPFQNGIAYVREPGMWGFIDKTGNYVWRIVTDAERDSPIVVDKTKFSDVYPAVWFSPSTGEIAPLKEKSEVPPGEKYEIWIEPGDPEFGYNPDRKPKDVGFALLGKGPDVFRNPVIPEEPKLMIPGT